MNHAIFLFGCIGTRVMLAYLAMTFTEYLPYMGYIAILISAWFFYIFLTGSTKSGPEAGAMAKWWIPWRPIHGALYALFAYNAIHRVKSAWKILLVDVMVALLAFLTHY